MYQCNIIGYPLNKPRSLKIWKKHFRLKKIASKMEPLEVKKKDLQFFFNKIKEDKNFLASAVTSPLKIPSFKFIIPGDLISKKAGSINFIIKKKKNFFGYNTDIISLIEIIKKYKKKNILIIGLGGVGLALAKVLSISKKFNVYALSSKKNCKINKIKIFKKFKDVNLDMIELIINCTPLGSDLSKEFLNKTPISKYFFPKIKKYKIQILDIIYKPKKTLLHGLCKKFKINYSNGIKMNSSQAKIALQKIDYYLKKKK